MSAQQETALQVEMFSGALIDTRTRKQKQADLEHTQPKQMGMFSSSEVAQFGVNPHPLLPLSDTTRLVLVSEDLRTLEEKERDLQREAEERTRPMFRAQSDQEVADEPDEELLLFYRAMNAGLGFPVF